MFTIPVWDLLASYSGDSKEFSFEWEVYDGYFEDIKFLSPLKFRIKIVSVDDGVMVLFSHFSTQVQYDGKKHTISINEFERHFKKDFDPISDPNDIQPIDTKNMSIDISAVIREEIIMATF